MTSVKILIAEMDAKIHAQYMPRSSGRVRSGCYCSIVQCILQWRSRLTKLLGHRTTNCSMKRRHANVRDGCKACLGKVAECDPDGSLCPGLKLGKVHVLCRFARKTGSPSKHIGALKPDSEANPYLHNPSHPLHDSLVSSLDSFVPLTSFTLLVLP